MEKKMKRSSEQVAWDIYITRAKMAERRKVVETLNKYLKKDEQKLEELLSSIDAWLGTLNNPLQKRIFIFQFHLFS